jgi:hypothetical protein
MDPTRALKFVSSRLSGRRLDWTIAGLAFLVTMLPQRLLSPWTNGLAHAISVPLLPLTHSGSYLRDRIRPPRERFDARAPEAIALAQEAEQYRTLYEGARLQAERLERAIAALQAVSTRVGEQGVRFVEASVVGADPSRRDGVVRINAGARHGVVARAPVFIDGDIFAGMVADEVGPFTASVIPATRLSGILVRVLPATGSNPGVALGAYPRGVLKPTPRGTWTAELPAAEGLAPGAIVRLEDERYPRAALGARVGVVTSVEPLEQAPLARRIEVAPIVALASAPTVVVVAAEAADAAEGSSR